MRTGMPLEIPAILVAHAAYRIGEECRRRMPDAEVRTVRSLDELRAEVAWADVLVVSGLWRDELAAAAPRLRFIQSISAGTDQFSREVLTRHGIGLASAQGANERAVAEHAMALLLALTRQLPQAVHDQAARSWRGMIGDPALRQDELSGKTMLIVGLGRIGTRLARLAQAFEMRVVGLRRSPWREGDVVAEIVAPDRLHDALGSADIVALTCPLTPETERLIGPSELRAMKRTAYLVNVARGRVIDQAALVAALAESVIAGAALDCFEEEPLPAASPLWGLRNVLVTPHTAGETRRYEEAVVEILTDNLARLGRGDELRNRIV